MEKSLIYCDESGNDGPEERAGWPRVIAHPGLPQTRP